MIIARSLHDQRSSVDRTPIDDPPETVQAVDPFVGIGVGCLRDMAAIAALLTADPAPLREGRARRLVALAPAREVVLHVWSDQAVTLAAAWSPSRPAPWAAFDNVHVVYDGRFDDRSGLRRALAATGPDVPIDATDASLLARAYAAWGSDGLTRVSGEFAACIWDGRRQVLVAARDRFGVKPLFYGAHPDAVTVCSSLTALRRESGQAERLSDEAIGDFLLFGAPQDPGATCFAGLSRVPPASTVAFELGRSARAASYWHPVAVEPLRYRDPREYVDHFRETLRTCVLERLDGGFVSIFMSGGLDSSSVAAMATGPGGARPEQCLAVTAVYDTLFPDQERRFSAVVARALGVEIQHVPVDHYDLFDRWDRD
ncbi:MAG TPA: asparagine synthase-related protein, partial [Vicinamibacterales bacterium]